MLHDARGQTTAVTRPNGEVTYSSYDQGGNVSSITPPGRTVQAFDYTPVDQISAYDPPVRFIETLPDRECLPPKGEGRTGGVRRDENGNRIAFEDLDAGVLIDTTTYDAQDRLLGYGDVSFTYDANGTLETRVDPVNGLTEYDYDEFGNLREVVLEAGTPSETVIAYRIDPMDRRIGRLVDGVLTHRWMYRDQLTPVAEYDGANRLVWRFVHGTRSNVPEYGVRYDPVTGAVVGTYRFITDLRGSVRLVVRADGGAGVIGTVAQRIDYDPWGRVLADTNPGFQPFGFAGGLWDAATGLVRFGARDYDPEVGRWTAKDPIGFGGGDTLLYGYVGGDPVNGVDPSGLWCVDLNIFGGLLGGISYGVLVGPSGFFPYFGAGFAVGVGASASFSFSDPSPGKQSWWGVGVSYASLGGGPTGATSAGPGYGPEDFGFGAGTYWGVVYDPFH